MSPIEFIFGMNLSWDELHTSLLQQLSCHGSYSDTSKTTALSLKSIPWTLAEFRHENYLTYVGNIKKSEVSLKSRVWIVVRPTENDSTRLYKNGDISVVISCS